MKIALNFSLQRKIIANKDYKIINKHLNNKTLFQDLKNYFQTKHINKILSFMTKDKKNDTDKINLVLLKKIGAPIIEKNFNQKYLKNFFQKQLTN